MLKKLCFTSLDDMYAAIGYGGISALKVIGRLREDIQRIIHQHQTERQEEVPVADQPQIMRPAVPQRTKGEQGIVVEGLTNCLVKFSKCCTPVPGDDIVGFITRGYGISVHRADCPNADPARRKPNEAGRWIKVSWGSDTKGELPHHAGDHRQGSHQHHHGRVHGAVQHQGPRLLHERPQHAGRLRPAVAGHRCGGQRAAAQRHAPHRADIGRHAGDKTRRMRKTNTKSIKENKLCALY